MQTAINRIAIIISLAFSFLLAGNVCDSFFFISSIDSVFFIPSGVKSNIHERIATKGNPRARRMVQRDYSAAQ